jgi:hypothetical protein
MLPLGSFRSMSAVSGRRPSGPSPSMREASIVAAEPSTSSSGGAVSRAITSEAPPRTVEHVGCGSASLAQCWSCPASSRAGHLEGGKVDSNAWILAFKTSRRL